MVSKTVVVKTQAKIKNIIVVRQLWRGSYRYVCMLYRYRQLRPRDSSI